MRAAATTPAEPAGACVARYPAAGSLPCISGGSASTLPVSRPARRSLAWRPAWSLSRLRGPLPSECFGRYRYLHHPLRLLPAGATVAGRDSHPLGSGAFARRTEKCGLRSRTNEAHPRPGAPASSSSTDTPARAECRASPLVAESLSSGMAPLPGVHSPSSSRTDDERDREDGARHTDDLPAIEVLAKHDPRKDHSTRGVQR